MSSPEKMTAAEILAQALARAGCRRAFGVPGGEVLTLMDALDREGIAFQLVKHENAGAFMAEGGWHADSDAGRPAPGILVATIGPGLANAVNAVINAAQDQVPMIVIAGAAEAAEAATYTHQVFDQVGLMRAAAKASFSVPDGAADVVAGKAIQEAMAAPQGPVFLDLPSALAEKEQTPPRRYATPAAAAVAPADGADLDRAREMLGRAQKPIVVAGVGAVLSEAGPALREVCERFSAPLLTTYKGKGLLDETHPLSLGGHGLSPLSDKIVLPLLSEADCVLAVGYDPIEMRHGWIDPWDPAVCIELTHLPNRHGMHGAAVSYVGDVLAGLKRVTGGLAPAHETWPGGAPAKTRAQLAETFATRDDWGPHQVFAAARKACPPETVATVDSGAHRILMSQMWACPSPRTLLQSSAFCTMGVALPLAIGRKLAEPDRPVLAVMGDAGLEMVMGELATLRDLRLGLPVLVLVDESLALIELKQRRSQLPNLGVDFPGTDFVALAKALGGHGAVVHDAVTLRSELSAAFARDTFTIVAAVIERKAYDGAF